MRSSIAVLILVSAVASPSLAAPLRIKAQDEARDLHSRVTLSELKPLVKPLIIGGLGGLAPGLVSFLTTPHNPSISTGSINKRDDMDDPMTLLGALNTRDLEARASVLGTVLGVTEADLPTFLRNGGIGGILTGAGVALAPEVKKLFNGGKSSNSTQATRREIYERGAVSSILGAAEQDLPTILKNGAVASVASAGVVEAIKKAIGSFGNNNSNGSSKRLLTSLGPSDLSSLRLGPGIKLGPGLKLDSFRRDVAERSLLDDLENFLHLGNDGSFSANPRPQTRDLTGDVAERSILDDIENFLHLGNDGSFSANPRPQSRDITPEQLLAAAILSTRGLDRLD
ncbi:hypothetical protein BC834DRAFT_294682 [Gloeopeniophorella convolvens]|nr:hypothetical protein BC834DRAFT_294682 [Gloeopeniophorella convolvens]